MTGAEILVLAEAEATAAVIEVYAEATGLTPEAVAVLDAGATFTAAFGEAEALRSDIAAYEVQLMTMRSRLEQLDALVVTARDAYLALTFAGESA